MAKGYVYILINPAFKEDWVKIGQTSGTVEERMKNLFTTALPTPFILYAWCRTSKFKELEKQAHHILSKLTNTRIADNREFYRKVPSEVLSILRDLATTLDDAEFYCPFEQQKTTIGRNSAPAFRFKMARVKPGDVIIFEPTGAQATVVDDKCDNKIEYQGERYTLSGFCKKYMPENRRNTSESYQGPIYFSFDGNLLCDLREKYDFFEE